MCRFQEGSGNVEVDYPTVPKCRLVPESPLACSHGVVLVNAARSQIPLLKSSVLLMILLAFIGSIGIENCLLHYQLLNIIFLETQAGRLQLLFLKLALSSKVLCVFNLEVSFNIY